MCSLVIRVDQREALEEKKNRVSCPCSLGGKNTFGHKHLRLLPKGRPGEFACTLHPNETTRKCDCVSPADHTAGLLLISNTFIFQDHCWLRWSPATLVLMSGVAAPCCAQAQKPSGDSNDRARNTSLASSASSKACVFSITDHCRQHTSMLLFQILAMSSKSFG